MVLATPPVPLSGQGVPCLGLGRVQGVAKWLVCVVNGTDNLGGKIGADHGGRIATDRS